MDEDHYLQAAAPLSQLRQPQQQAAACLYFQMGRKKDVNGNHVKQKLVFLLDRRTDVTFRSSWTEERPAWNPVWYWEDHWFKTTRPSRLSLLFFTQSVNMINERFPPRVLIWAVKRHWIISNPKCYLQRPDSSQVWIAAGSNLGWKFRWSLFGLHLLRQPVLMPTDWSHVHRQLDV